MKKIIIFILFLFTASFFSQNTFKLGFTGCYPNNYDYWNNMNHPWSNYTELSMNSWSGWWVGDNLTDNPNVQLPWAIENLNSYNINGYLQPDTIRAAGYGRVVYHNAATHTHIPHFYYDVHHWGGDYPDNTQFGNGQYVYYLATADLDGNFNANVPALSGVHNNWMQSYCYYQEDPAYTTPFPYGSVVSNTWYIKPRMRISVSDAFGQERNVVRIVVKAYNGETILNEILTTLNFREANNTYIGEYLQDYLNKILYVEGDINNLNRGRVGGSQNWNEMPNCQVDYQIYWYGLVDVWIDYVKVMDDWANKLMDPLDQYHIQQRIVAKVQSIKDHDPGNKLQGFYMEETGIDNVTCLRYLQNLLKTNFPDNYYPGARMCALYNQYSYQANLKWDDCYSYYDAEKMFIDSVQPGIVMTDNYPWGDYIGTGYNRNWLPNNIPSLQLQNYYPQFLKNDAQWFYNNVGRVSPAQYNDILQNYAFGGAGGFINTIKTAKTGISGTNAKLILVPQIHLWLNSDTWASREPMNSEISAEFCIALCYGVNGIMPYSYEGNFWPVTASPPPGGKGRIDTLMQTGPNNREKSYSIGMVDFDGSVSWGNHQRHLNFYGEDKWQYVKDLYSKVNNWGNIVANSNNTQGFSVHSETANHEFVYNIQSIIPGQTGANPCATDDPTPLTMDCPDERYWEMGFFNPSASPKYFMMVNRRCVPAGGGYAGDNRILRISFKQDQLPTYNTWKITDIYTGQSYSFLKSYQGPGGYVAMGETPDNLGYFKPGEGKLFKLEPVILNGGELAGDETIPSGNYTILDTIFTNGYDLTIEEGAHLYFTDTSTIVVEGGKFTAGTVSEGQPSIFFSAALGNTFHGLNFTGGAEVKIYKSSFSGLAIA